MGEWVVARMYIYMYMYKYIHTYMCGCIYAHTQISIHVGHVTAEIGGVCACFACVFAHRCVFVCVL